MPDREKIGINVSDNVCVINVYKRRLRLGLPVSNWKETSADSRCLRVASIKT